MKRHAGYVVRLGRAAGEVPHRVNHRAGRPSRIASARTNPNPRQCRQQPRKTEHFPCGVLGVRHPVSVNTHALARSQIDTGHRIDLLGHQTQRCLTGTIVRRASVPRPNSSGNSWSALA